MVNGSCFHQYDIRGIYPTEIDEDLSYKIGNALVTKFRFKIIGVGHDARQSTPQIKEALINGILDAGANVEDWGYTTTDEVAFGAPTRKMDGVVMITASHNPKEFNGFKFSYGDASPLGAKGEIQEIDKYISTGQPVKVAQRGQKNQYDLSTDYINYLFSLVPPERLPKSLKIVLDASNGVAATIAQKLFSRLPQVELVELNFNLDGSFPSHAPNPIQPINSEQLSSKVREVEADAGFIFDGDGDRLYLIDNAGNWQSGSVTGAMIALDILSEIKGAKIMGNTVTSKAFKELIEKNGGQYFKGLVGHSWIKAMMRENDCVYGSEHSGHFYFKDFYYLDSGFLAMMHVLSLMNKDNSPTSGIGKSLNPYYQSGELNFIVADQQAMMNLIKDKYIAQAEFSDIDGYTFTTPKLWFNVRPSNNEPLLRLNVEADSQEEMVRMVNEVSSLIQSNGLGQRSQQ